MATSVKIDDTLKERIRRLAEARHRSPHWLMREAIEQYITREEQREAFKQEALNAWREYQETGLHVTGEEVGRWLRGWGTDNEQPASECHE